MQNEFGGKRGIGHRYDTNSYNAYLAKKGEGKSPDQVAHELWEASPVGEGGEKRWSDVEIKQAMLDLLQGAEKPTDISHKLVNDRIDEIRRRRAEMKEEYERMEEEAKQREGDTEEIVSESQPFEDPLVGGIYNPDEVAPFQKVEDESGAPTKEEVALRDALVEKIAPSVDVVMDERGQRVLDAANGNVRAQKMKDNLHKASKAIKTWLSNGVRNKVFTIELPEATLRMIRREVGRDFDSHNITINGIIHGIKNHGVGGKKLTENSIPIREEDAELIPYIMTAPDYVEAGTPDLTNRSSLRFYKNLSNGYVVVVEKEYKNSPNDMETINIWAELSPSEAINARRSAPGTNVRNAILSTEDAAKIRKDAETAIENELKKPKSHKVSDTPEEKEKTGLIFDTAKKKFGVTSDLREAGYILPDGTMLDFSGRHELFGADDSGISGRRATDHRGISQIAYAYDAEGNEVDTGVETTMPDFIERGAIRIDANAGTINLSVKPTAAQRKALQRLIQRNGGDVSVDYGNGWDSDHYSEYDSAGARRVLSDIDRYFDEGIRTDGNIKYFRTSSGEAYGFTLGGKIYIDPRIARADTPIHEYTHLWAEGMRESDPDGWKKVVDLMRGEKELWEKVKKDYPELKTDDEVADEVLAHYSGTRGAERLREEMRKIAEGDGTMDEKTRAISALENVRRALNNFWRSVANRLGIKFTTAEEVADMVLRDMLNGVDPRVKGSESGAHKQEVLKGDIFVSNARKAVEGIKQKKATGDQWLAMIQKAGGLKAGEDKWMGLSDWLNERKGKPVTKEEVMDFVRQNQVQVEEVNYQEEAPKGDTLEKRLFQFGNELTREAIPLAKKDGISLEDECRKLLNERYGEGWDEYITFDHLGFARVDEYADQEGAAKFFGIDYDKNAVHEIDSTRLAYTTDGLDNKKEIALVVPTVKPWNENDEVHFGDAGGGRAVAWVRFGDTTDADGNNVLVIDEIQSNRHQQGREKGYYDVEEIRNLRKEYENLGREQYTLFANAPEEARENRTHQIQYLYSADAPEGIRERFFAIDERRREILKQIDSAMMHGGKVPDAPFDKNWHELAMKRMLRYAAENGYDKVAWTTGDQQAERYNLKHMLNGDIKVETDPHPASDERAAWKTVTLPLEDSEHIIRVNKDGKVVNSHIIGGQDLYGMPLSEFVGKDLAERIMGTKDGSETITIDEVSEFGGEGMKGFYDEILPRFMKKYGKKWGATVGEVELPYVEEAGRRMHAVDVTPEMRVSVLQGQPMFQKAEQNHVEMSIVEDPKEIERTRPFHDFIDELFTNPDFDRQSHFRDKFDLGDTPNYMKTLGITGDYFTLPYKSIKVHLGKDEDHDLSSKEWHKLPYAIKHPFLITTYKNEKGKFRLYTSIRVGNKFAVVGVDVIKVNRGRNVPMLELNRIKTVFGRDRYVMENGETILAYDENITPEQKALLRGHNLREYPTIQELSESKDSKSSSNLQGNGEENSQGKANGVEFVGEGDWKPGPVPQYIKRWLGSTTGAEFSNQEKSTILEGYNHIKAQNPHAIAMMKTPKGYVLINEDRRMLANDLDAIFAPYVLIKPNDVDLVRAAVVRSGKMIGIVDINDDTWKKAAVRPLTPKQSTESVTKPLQAEKDPGVYGWADRRRTVYGNEKPEFGSLSDAVWWVYDLLQGAEKPTDISHKLVNDRIDEIRRRRAEMMEEYERTEEEAKQREGDTEEIVSESQPIEDPLVGGIYNPDEVAPFQKVEDESGALTKEEVAARDVLVDAAKKIFGDDVVTDWEVGQRMLNKANGNVKMSLDDVRDFVLRTFDSVKKGQAAGRRIPIGYLTNSGRQYLESISGLHFKEKISFILNASDLRHIYKEHYGSNEKDTGNNIPLTDKDIRSLVDVICSPDHIVYGLDKKDGRKIFYFLKDSGNGAYNLAEVYSDKHGNLTAKTFYKTKKGSHPRAVELINSSTLSTSVTSGASPLSNAKIPQLFDISIENELKKPKSHKVSDTPEEKEKTGLIFDTAKKKFGLTSDIREAGYILPDGTMLDFSGRHELFGADDSGISGRRATDHRGISQIAYAYDAEGNEVDTGVETTMPDFIERGAIRIDANAGTINLSVKPTAAQRKALQRLIQRNGGDVSVDYGNGWDSDHYSEYDSASARRVLSDIDRYFDEGIRTDGNIKYFRTSSGEAYGFTLGGKIYIDPRIARADTPIHEYTHLWAEGMRESDPESWKKVVDLMRGEKELWKKVKKDYPELKTDDEVADEVLAHYSGTRGAERLREEMRKIAEGDGTMDEKTRAISALENVRRALNNFWRSVANRLGIKFTTAEEVADMVLRDMLNGVDPRERRLLDESEKIEKEAEQVRFSIVDDPKEIERLENEPKEKGYRNVVMKEDGSFGSPMADRLGSKGKKRSATTPFGINQWERSDENPDLATEEGKIDLIKPGSLGTVNSVDYNPYIHIRPTTLNKQFKNAWERPDLVYVETEYPASELTSGYRADKAKKTVGKHPWGGGELILSRWDKPVRIVPWEEVANEWEAEFKDIGVNFDIVPPKLLPILAERGVEILPPHKGMGKECNDAYLKWKESQGANGERVGTSANNVSFNIGKSMSEVEAKSFVERMQEFSETAVEIELTPENWIEQFGEDGIVSTPIGEVKMGENQYFKLAQQGRKGKLGMVKPTLENPDIIVEDNRPAKDGNQERDYSYVFVKTFVNKDGERYYHFTSVTVQKDGKEVVISNQERRPNRISKLLQEGKVTWTNERFSSHPNTRIEGPVPLNDSNRPTSTDNQPALLGINSSEHSKSKDSKSSSNLQANGEENSSENRKSNQPSFSIATATKVMFSIQDEIKRAEEETEIDISEAQKKAGNYKKGHVKIDGFDFTIEQPKGSVRSGVDESGKAWSTKMNNTYGYIRGTEGVDGDHIDVFLSDHMDDWNGIVYVVDQVKEDGTFDEHKVMYGFNSPDEAQKAYLSNYEKGWKGLGTLTSIGKDVFKEWVDSSHRKTKPFAEYKMIKGAEVKNEYSNISAPLSDELNEYAIPFVVSSDGTTYFGNIDKKSGLPALPIKLNLGENYVDEEGKNHGYGLLHIEAGHGQQIREAGFSSIEEFVEIVGRNYRKIRKGSVVANNQTYLLELFDEHNNTLFIQLSRDGGYWNVNSAGIFKEKYSRRKPEVYTRPALEPGTSTDSSEVNHGQTEGATVTSRNSS